MKKILFAMLTAALATGMAVAQTSLTQGATQLTTGEAGSVAPAVDVLGAHNNYGRGCAGCHAPHSGAGGAGVAGSSDTMTGANALFAQDLGPLYGSLTADFSDISANGASAGKYIFTAPASITAGGTAYYDVRGILMCLACHDGSITKGAMMQNNAYEQQIGALPSTYGTGKIPTLLGADGSSSAYHNDHPVGKSATLAAVLGSTLTDTANGLGLVMNGSSIGSYTPAGQYAQFVASYGAPAIFKGAHSYPTPVDPATNQPYVVCTTCHDQHVMNVYAASSSVKIAGSATGTYAKFFFVNGPYNVNNINVPATSAASTTQFCRQCHFGESNEANGGTLPTAF